MFGDEGLFFFWRLSNKQPNNQLVITLVGIKGMTTLFFIDIRLGVF